MARSRRSSAVSSVSPFGRYLADQNVAGVHLRTDADDTVLVQILQRVVADVRDVAGDFLRPQLGVAGLALEFFNVNGGVNVVP